MDIRCHNPPLRRWPSYPPDGGGTNQSWMWWLIADQSNNWLRWYMDWHVTPALFDDTGLTIMDTWHRALLIHFFYIAHRPACHVSGWHWELCQVCSLFQNLELRAASLGGILTQKAGNHRFLDLKDVTQRLTFVQVFAQHSSDLFVLVQGGTTSGNLAGPH